MGLVNLLSPAARPRYQAGMVELVSAKNVGNAAGRRSTAPEAETASATVGHIACSDDPGLADTGHQRLSAGLRSVGQQGPSELASSTKG